MLDSRSFAARCARLRPPLCRILLPILVAFNSAAAQDSTAARSPDWLLGGSVALPGASAEAFYPLAMVGVRATQLRPNRPGLDLSLMTAPYPFAFGVANLVGTAGVTLPLRVQPGLYLLPAVGATVAGAAGFSGDGGVGALLGYNAGVSALITGGSSSGLRAGVTWHRFGDSGEPVWMMELGWGTLR